MIRVMLADDHPALREGIKQRLERMPEIMVVGEAGSGSELLATLDGKPSPDVLLLDIRMPDFDIRKAIPRLRAHHPTTRILVVTAYDDQRNISQAIEAGVDGYLVKQEDMAIYAAAIRELAAGRTYFSQRVLGVALDNADMLRPSPRELEVLTWVVKDATTDEIANRLGISPRTVETHVKRACQKLGVTTRAAAVAKATQLGYISALD